MDTIKMYKSKNGDYKTARNPIISHIIFNRQETKHTGNYFFLYKPPSLLERIKGFFKAVFSFFRRN